MGKLLSFAVSDFMNHMAAPQGGYSAEDALEAKALANPFIQTPPLQRLEATACVVYGLN